MRLWREKVMNSVLPSFVDLLSAKYFCRKVWKKNKQRFRRKTGREEAAARSQMVAMSWQHVSSSQRRCLCMKKVKMKSEDVKKESKNGKEAGATSQMKAITCGVRVFWAILERKSFFLEMSSPIQVFSYTPFVLLRSVIVIITTRGAFLPIYIAHWQFLTHPFWNFKLSLSDVLIK